MQCLPAGSLGRVSCHCDCNGIPHSYSKSIFPDDFLMIIFHDELLAGQAEIKSSCCTQGLGLLWHAMSIHSKLDGWVHNGRKGLGMQISSASIHQPLGLILRHHTSHSWWTMPAIPAFRRWKPEDHEFKASLGFLGPASRRNKKRRRRRKRGGE